MGRPEAVSWTIYNALLVRLSVDPTACLMRTLLLFKGSLQSLC